jgi:hypothetical protein
LPFVALCLVGVFSSVSFEPLIVRLRERSSAPGRPRAKELSGVQKPLNGE